MAFVVLCAFPSYTDYGTGFRHMVIAAIGSTADATATITVDGNSTTERTVDTGSFTQWAERAQLPGGSLPISVTWNASQTRCVIHVWSIIGNGVASPELVGTLTETATGFSRTLTPTVPYKGVALVAGSDSVDIAGISFVGGTVIEEADVTGWDGWSHYAGTYAGGYTGLTYAPPTRLAGAKTLTIGKALGASFGSGSFDCITYQSPQYSFFFGRDPIPVP